MSTAGHKRSRRARSAGANVSHDGSLPLGFMHQDAAPAIGDTVIHSTMLGGRAHISRRHSIHNHPGSYHYASLIDAGLVSDPESTVIEGPARSSGSVPGPRSILQAYRAAIPHQGTKERAFHMLHRGVTGDADGMPSEEAEVYMGNGKFAEDLFQNCMTELGGSFKKCYLRVDTAYRTKHAGGPNEATIPVALMGDGVTLGEEPRHHRGSKVGVRRCTTLTILSTLLFCVGRL